MNVARHAWSCAGLCLAFCFILAAPSFASDVEIYETGSGESLGYRIKNTSDATRYQVDIEVKRLDLKSGDVISARLDTITLSPLADISLGLEIQQNARVKYRVASVRQAGKGPGVATRGAGKMPAPYPIMFNK